MNEERKKFIERSHSNLLCDSIYGSVLINEVEMLWYEQYYYFNSNLEPFIDLIYI